MIYLIIALVLVVLLAGVLAWRLYVAVRALGLSRARCRALQRERDQRRNLQTILDNRSAEVRKLRERLRALEAEAEAMRQEASELNLNLFHESSLRILREKEEGSRRMKQDLLEKQLDDAGRQLRRLRAENARLNGVIADLNEAMAAPPAAPKPRRAARRGREGLPNQVTLEDLMGESGE